MFFNINYIFTWCDYNIIHKYINYIIICILYAVRRCSHKNNENKIRDNLIINWYYLFLNNVLHNVKLLFTYRYIEYLVFVLSNHHFALKFLRNQILY